MNEIKKISNSFEETLKDTNLQSVSIELTEVITDSLLKDGILKDIPIIGTIVGLGKTTLNIKDHLFLKKIIYFISEIKDIDIQKRNEMISKIEESKKFRIKVGEKLLYIIDKCEDHTSSEYIAKMFNAFLSEKIDYTDFLRASSIIQNMFLYDFENFISIESYEIEKKISGEHDYMNDFESNLISNGLCSTKTTEVSVSEEPSHTNWEKSRLVTKGGETILYITEIGQNIRELLKN